MINNLKFLYNILQNALPIKKKGPAIYSMGSFKPEILNDYSIYKNLDTGETFNIKSWHLKRIDNSTLIHRELIVLELEDKLSGIYTIGIPTGTGSLTMNSIAQVCNIEVNCYEYYIDSDSNLIFEPLELTLCKFELNMSDDSKRLKKLENI